MSNYWSNEAVRIIVYAIALVYILPAITLYSLSTATLWWIWGCDNPFAWATIPTVPLYLIYYFCILRKM